MGFNSGFKGLISSLYLKVTYVLLYPQIPALREDNSAYESVRFVCSQQCVVATLVPHRGQSARSNRR